MVTLAGYQIWQGVIQKSIPQGVIVIQNNTVNDVANYFFSKRAGWIIGVPHRRLLPRFHAHRRDPASGGTASPSVTRGCSASRTAAIIITTFVVVCDLQQGIAACRSWLLMIVGFMIFWTFIAKRTTFGRHVYAVGGNAEGARRAGIDVARVRIIVFMISSGMAGVGGVMLAARLNSVDLNAGGGTLLIDAIAAWG